MALIRAFQSAPPDLLIDVIDAVCSALDEDELPGMKKNMNSFVQIIRTSEEYKERFEEICPVLKEANLDWIDLP